MCLARPCPTARAHVDPVSIARLRLAALELLAPSCEPIEWSPVCPLGTIPSLPG